MAEIVDHISDDGFVSLCGVKEEDLPAAPLCPACVAVERRTGPAPGEIRGAGFVHRSEQPVRR